MHMNNTNSTKYNLPPELVEKKSLDKKNGDYFRDIYDFLRVRKIETNQSRNLKYNLKKDRRIRKKDAPGSLYKASTENIPFFNRDRIFTIYKRAKLENGIYLYWLTENGRKVAGRFIRQELFTLNNQFLS